MARSNEAKNQERQDILLALQKKGKCVSPEEDIYGWIDHKAERHIKDFAVDSKGKITESVNCSWVVDPDAVIEDANIDQFDSTFTGNSTESVINVFPVSCACGQYVERTLRYEGDLGSFLVTLFHA